MKNILVANIFGIGDVLFTTPLIANLKKHLEGVRIDYLCNARTRPVIECDPDVDDVFVYEKDDLLKLWRDSKPECIGKLHGLFSSIKKKKYDAVFDFTLSRGFGFVFATCRIPKRIGLKYKNRGIFLTDGIDFTGFKDKHVIEYYLDLLEFVGAPAAVKDMQLVPDEALREKASRYRRDHSSGGKKFIAVIPGGGASWGPQASRKRWTPEGFAAGADILSEHGMDIGIFGDSSEKELCKNVKERMKAKPVVVENDLPLKDYIAMLDACDLVLCNDGGPLHIAVGLGIKTVSIFGPVDEKVYGPYPPSQKHKIIKADGLSCRPCYDRFKLPGCENDNRCITDIEPGYVADACIKLLENDVRE